MISLALVHENLKKTYECFSKVLTDKNFEIVNTYLGWQGYERGISKLFYVQDYRNLVTDRQFSCALKENDGLQNQATKGLLQIIYDFDAGKLSKVRLAFYPQPIVVKAEYIENEDFTDRNSEQELQTVYDVLSVLVGYKFDFTNTTHIRIDYDAEVTAHSKTHIQISGINDLRIPINFIPLPFHFIDFLVKHLLPKEYKLIIKTKNYKALFAISNRDIEFQAQEEKSFFVTMKR